MTETVSALELEQRTIVAAKSMMDKIVAGCPGNSMAEWDFNTKGNEKISGMYGSVTDGFKDFPKSKRSYAIETLHNLFNNKPFVTGLMYSVETNLGRVNCRYHVLKDRVVIRNAKKFYSIILSEA